MSEIRDSVEPYTHPTTPRVESLIARHISGIIGQLPVGEYANLGRYEDVSVQQFNNGYSAGIVNFGSRLEPSDSQQVSVEVDWDDLEGSSKVTGLRIDRKSQRLIMQVPHLMSESYRMGAPGSDNGLAAFGLLRVAKDLRAIRSLLNK